MLMPSGEEQLQLRKERIRKHFLKYTRKAFRMLPQMDKPRILDIGCGSGVPTMELARLSNGQVTGLDINQTLLDRLTKKINKARISDRVKTLKCSILDMKFPDESFDIIWAEGSIHVIGFERGLREWKRFLKPNGFLAIHDEKGDIQGKIAQISGCDYELIKYFTLDKEIWWTEYFAPLQKLVDDARIKYADDSRALAEADDSQREIDIFKKNPELNSSAFFVMKRLQ
jgi:ubiquinone/menaquinone biosynthesis C-methylase UbiE